MQSDKKQVLCSIHDVAVHAFMRPWMAPTLEMGLRMFLDERTRPDSDVFRHPADYTMYVVGYFDPDSGVITPCVPPQRVACAAELEVEVKAADDQEEMKIDA